jgi:hexosaminidase
MTVIPRPTSVSVVSGGLFEPPAGGSVTAGPALAGVAAWLRGVLPAGFGGVTLRVDARPAGAYAVTVGRTEIDIVGGSPEGVFSGAQTLRQLLPPWTLRRAPVADSPVTLPLVRITDQPRFRWRGVMLDVARHFMPVADVLRFIDLAALHKLNVLHLHLTDDQGWRIEVPGWPRLTSVGAWRTASMLGSRVHGKLDGRPHGGFYTADDLREIVAYAAARFVTVVPEVDMPGHMQAAIAAYPELGNGFAGPVRTGWGISTHVLSMGPVALDFCRAVLDHVCDIFPSPLIGIGGDECPTGEWDAAGLPAGVQARFTAQMAAHLAARGRRVFGWDEILGGGAPAGAVVAAWRGVEPTRVAARAGHDVVACPDIAAYLDYRQSEDPAEPTPVGTVLTLSDAYAFEPVPSGLTPDEQARVVGGQANIWTEHMESARRVDYMAFPRLCAIAEALWSAAGDRDFADFTDRLGAHLARLDALGVNYRPLSGPRPWDARPDAPGHPRSLCDRLAELHEMTADLREGIGDDHGGLA